MADKVISLESIKAFWHSQVHDPDKWDLNMAHKNIKQVAIEIWRKLFLIPFLLLQKLLRAVGLFAGSIVLMRQYGDMMAI